MTKKKLQHYLRLPYRMNLTFDEESNAWIVRYPELPGCIAHGATPDQALTEGEEAKALWIETAIGDNQQVPQPQPHGEPMYSGKLVLRLPRSLHEAAAESADREGISLNTYLVHLVSEGVQRSGLKNLYGLLEGRFHKTFGGSGLRRGAELRLGERQG
jgi:predicted RNase H-like HicB family nuclease